MGIILLLSVCFRQGHVTDELPTSALSNGIIDNTASSLASATPNGDVNSSSSSSDVMTRYTCSSSDSLAFRSTSNVSQKRTDSTSAGGIKQHSTESNAQASVNKVHCSHVTQQHGDINESHHLHNCDRTDVMTTKQQGASALNCSHDVVSSSLDRSNDAPSQPLTNGHKVADFSRHPDTIFVGGAKDIVNNQSDFSHSSQHVSSRTSSSNSDRNCETKHNDADVVKSSYITDDASKTTKQQSVSSSSSASAPRSQPIGMHGRAMTHNDRLSSSPNLSSSSTQQQQLLSSSPADAALSSSPSAARLKRQPTKETRKFSLSDSDGYTQLNQYRLKDEIGKVVFSN